MSYTSFTNDTWATLGFDIVIVGAGISGICQAYWLKKKCPNKKFIILEARDSIGGTWSLFHYPGIRSDSDMFTYGYRFKPWDNPQSLSSGKEILNYLQETIDENGLMDAILFNHKMKSANWSDTQNTWTLQVETQNGMREIVSQFLCVCTGYYNYGESHQPSYSGEERYKGLIVNPQFWPDNLDVKEKKIAVIGSGATAMTMVPALVDKGADHVIVVQRSPSYVLNLPSFSKMYLILKQILPQKLAFKVTRIKNVLLQIFSFTISKLLPGLMRTQFQRAVARQLPDGFDVARHFRPNYNPWEQRLCVIPDGNLFRKIHERSVSMETNMISHFNSDGISLTSGKDVKADIIVLATGFKNAVAWRK